jgi:hypothetical protein
MTTVRPPRPVPTDAASAYALGDTLALLRLASHGLYSPPSTGAPK